MCSNGARFSGAPAAHPPERNVWPIALALSSQPSPGGRFSCSSGQCLGTHVHTCPASSGLCASRTSLSWFDWYFSAKFLCVWSL